MKYSIPLVIDMNCYGIVIVMTASDSGTITSNLRIDSDLEDKEDLVIDAIESLVLAHACAGIDVTSNGYVEGIETVIDALGDR